MKAVIEEPVKVIEVACPTCGCRKPAKPICGFCGDPIQDWPDNPEQFLLDRGWRPVSDDPGQWRQPLARLRTEEVLVKLGERLIDNRLTPVYQTHEPDSDYAYAEKEAVDHELRLQRGPSEPISYSEFVFDDKAMAALRAEQCNSTDREAAHQLEEMKKAKSNVFVSPCIGCGSWPDNWSRKKALRKAYESPPVETCIRGSTLSQAQTTNSLEETAHE